MRIVQRGKKTLSQSTTLPTQTKSTVLERRETRKKRKKLRLSRSENVSSIILHFTNILMFLAILFCIRNIWYNLSIPSKRSRASTHTKEKMKGHRHINNTTFTISSELREKYRFILEHFLIKHLGYENEMFQKSVHMIRQNLHLNTIDISEMAPQFQALLWLADEPFFKNLFHDDNFKKNNDMNEIPLDLSKLDTKMTKLERLHLAQRFSLAIFYFSTNGDTEWKECARNISDETSPCPDEGDGISRFLSHSTNECYWYGIICNPGSGNEERKNLIKMIDLTDNGLTSIVNKDSNAVVSSNNANAESILPAEFVYLSPSLQLLWLHGNTNLNGTIPKWIHHMKGLVSLNLHGTGLSGSIPKAFYELENLESIRLHNCRLTGTISSSIKNIHALKWLWIHENELEGIFPSNEIKELHSLEGISIYGNKIEIDTVEIPDICDLWKKNLQHFWVDCYQNDECKCCSKCLPKLL